MMTVTPPSEGADEAANPSDVEPDAALGREKPPASDRSSAFVSPRELIEWADEAIKETYEICRDFF